MATRTGIVADVTREARRRLEAIVSDRCTAQKHVRRADIVLATADGCGGAEIMRRTGKPKPVAGTWRERFMAEGVEGLLRDETRRPGKKPLPPDTVARVVDPALGPPPGETTHRTGRMPAKAPRVGLRSVQRIAKAHRLAPHRMRTFKPSNDPGFAETLKDAVGLYVNPPAHAVVPSVDGKSRVRALDRTRPGRPMKKGRARRHDPRRQAQRHDGAVRRARRRRPGRNMQRHRHREFIGFLNTVEAQVPAGKIIHAILDNHATGKHQNLRKWRARHPRRMVRFTPTSASRLNAVEGFFAKLATRRLKRGVSHASVNPQTAANRFIPKTNPDPKPFIRTADPDRVIAAVKPGKKTLKAVH